MTSSRVRAPRLAPKRTPHPRRAFTLIELMIVVAIMAILAAVVVPMMISRAQRETSTGQTTTSLTQAPPALAAFAKERPVAPPRTRSSDVRVHLAYGPVLEGRDVRSRYVATFRGAFEVESSDPEADTITLDLPFPPGTAEARGVSLRLRTAGGALVEPPGVEYGLAGIHWRGAVSPGAVVRAEVAYEVLGQDAFSYAVASAGRTGKVQVRIDVEGPGEPVVPGTSLAPTTVAPGHLEWNVAELVADRPIVVELPPGASPLGRLVLLLRWAALGVLGFGAGFWYLSERHAPGRMDSFRFPHFLLLALNYSLFFAALGVILLWQPPAIALPLAAVLSLPLLVVHVGRIIDRGFAVQSALPLAVYTLASVVGAVLLDAQRPLVLLVSSVVALGYVTFTYKSWDAGRRAHRAERVAAAEEARRAAAEAKAEARVAVQAERVERGVQHCLVCGAHVDPAARFCGSCGAERPRAIPCGACGLVLRVPPQVLRRRWAEVHLHCESCGAALAIPAQARAPERAATAGAAHAP